jgi:hypothetical protein
MSTYPQQATYAPQTQTSDLSDIAFKALIGFAVVAVAVIAFSLWQVGSSLSKQACVDEAVGRYPGVPVSAYSGANSTAMKLSFVVERQKALDSCN